MCEILVGKNVFSHTTRVYALSIAIFFQASTGVGFLGRLRNLVSEFKRYAALFTFIHCINTKMNTYTYLYVLVGVESPIVNDYVDDDISASGKKTRVVCVYFDGVTSGNSFELAKGK